MDPNPKLNTLHAFTIFHTCFSYPFSFTATFPSFMPIALHFSHYLTHSIKPHDSHTLTGNLSSYRLMSDTRPPPRSLTCLYLKPSNAVSLELRSFVSSQVTSSVGSSLSSLQFSQWNLTRRHVEVLNVFVSVTVILVTWFFCSTILAFLAFERVSESLTELLDEPREHAPF